MPILLLLEFPPLPLLEGSAFRRVAIADKLGIEFALIHRQRTGKNENAPERMDVLVGDVRDRVSAGLI